MTARGCTCVDASTNASRSNRIAGGARPGTSIYIADCANRCRSAVTSTNTTRSTAGHNNWVAQTGRRQCSREASGRSSRVSKTARERKRRILRRTGPEELWTRESLHNTGASAEDCKRERLTRGHCRVVVVPEAKEKMSSYEARRGNERWSAQLTIGERKCRGATRKQLGSRKHAVI